MSGWGALAICLALLGALLSFTVWAMSLPTFKEEEHDDDSSDEDGGDSYGSV
jgi:hypothetical protein